MDSRRSMVVRIFVAAGVTTVVIALALVPFLGGNMFGALGSGVRFKGFDFAIWSRVSPVIQAHVLAATGALVVGLGIFLNRKGSQFHRAMGWSWVALMAVTALTSLFITGLNGDAYSIIHGLTAFTLVILPLAVFAARRKDIAAHRRHMTGLFLGGLVVAGLFTFIPGRLMWSLFFGA